MSAIKVFSNGPGWLRVWLNGKLIQQIGNPPADRGVRDDG